jgi:hypothetical protein
MKKWVRKNLVALSENTGLGLWKKSLVFLENIYLFLIFYWRIAKTQLMLRRIGLRKDSLAISLQTRNNLDFGRFPLRVINPSLCVKGKTIYGVARITNGYIERYCDYAGRPIQQFRTRGERLIEGIIEFQTDTFGHISNLRVLQTPTNIPNYQDPRIFSFKSEIYIVMTQMLEEKYLNAGRWRSGVSIQKVETGELINLKSPLSKGIEKNWIPILNEESIKLLYSSNPISIIELDNFSSNYKFHKTDYSSTLHLNNRSQMVKVKDDNFSYIRVASRKFANLKYGYTPLHYFELLSEEFKPLALSRPFVFSSRQMEICNSLVLDGETLILAWTENEETNMIGTLPIQSIFSMFSLDFDRRL